MSEGTTVALLITVGMDYRPVLSSVRAHRPAYTVFLCTEGSKRKCLAEDNGVPGQAGLPAGAWEPVVLPDPDDPLAIYETVRSQAAAVRARFPGAEIRVDFTGGTKSMSAAALLAAVDDSAVLPCFMRGLRNQAGDPVDETEAPFPLDTMPMLYSRQLEAARQAFADFHYAAAGALLADLATRRLAAPAHQYLRGLLALVRGLEYWDHFNLKAAHGLLSSVSRWVGEVRLQFLARSEQAFLRMEQRLEQEPRSNPDRPIPYAPVYDLLLNAERRAVRGRFDDAVARLYRATELYAQISLANRNPPVHTGNVLPDRLPAALATEYESYRSPFSGRIQIGLVQAYRLLEQLDHPVGRVYAEWSRPLGSVLEARNHSLLAHGRSPVTQRQYGEISRTVGDFLAQCDQAQRQKGFDHTLQFPRELPEMMRPES